MWTFVFWLGPIALLLASSPSFAQTGAEPRVEEQTEHSDPSNPAQIRVEPRANDPAIRDRLERIIRATKWFENAEISVDEGIVSLHGVAESAEAKRWAGEVAKQTEDVVAVINDLEVSQPSPFDFSPAYRALEDLWIAAVRAVPIIGVGLLTIAVAIILAFLASKVAHTVTTRRLASPLMRQVVNRAVATAVLLLGLYIALRISGLTRLAATVIGGTGLVGLVVGIAFRDITENFLASVFLSIQRPFFLGDLVRIGDELGIVQKLTMRSTMLMNLAGNHVQIPNSHVYRAVIWNYTSNPNRREDFVIGIGYSDAIPRAQAVALDVLAAHPAVLKAPEPWVLVDDLGKATVNLRIYFWMDGSQHSWLKVRSSVIRLVKRAFQDAGISLPDEAREIVFPEGVPVNIIGARDIEAPRAQAIASDERLSAKPLPEDVVTPAEGGLVSEKNEIDAQARKSRAPELGRDLLSE